MTAPARVAASSGRRRLCVRNVTASLSACSSVATWETTTSPSPSSVAPICAARSAMRMRLRGLGIGSLMPANVIRWRGGRVRLLVRERLDDLFGDVDARAREHHRVLDDEVELLGLRDLLD